MPTSNITNTITDPTGTAVPSVPVTILLVAALATGQAPGTIAASRISDGSEVAAQVTVTANASGVWTAALEQNANITPANTFYVAIENIPASAGGIRTWSFAVGGSNQTLQAALVSTPPTGVLSSFLTQAAGDARYVLSPGTFSGTVTPVTTNIAANSGAAASYSRGDHIHNYVNNYPKASVYLASATFSVPSATFTTMIFDTVREDPNSMYNTGTGIFTAPIAGRYLVCAEVIFPSSTGGQMLIAIGAATTYADATAFRRGTQAAPATGPTFSFVVSGVIRLTASQQFSIWCYQSTGGALNLFNATAGSFNYCDVQYLGP